MAVHSRAVGDNVYLSHQCTCVGVCACELGMIQDLPSTPKVLYSRRTIAGLTQHAVAVLKRVTF